MNKKSIYVCGDVNIDWLNPYAESDGSSFWAEKPEEIRVSSTLAGALILRELIKKLIPKSSAEVPEISHDPKWKHEPMSQITTSWTTWKDYENNKYRISSWNYHNKFNTNYTEFYHNLIFQSKKANLLVVHDANLGFRNMGEEIVPKLISTKDTELIIYKLYEYGNDISNPVLKHLNKVGLDKKTILVTRLSDVRKCQVNISHSLSWERLFTEIVNAVHNDEACPFFKHYDFQKVIIMVKNNGAIICSKNRKDCLIYDLKGQEDGFESRYPGEVIGSGNCISAVLAAQWFEQSTSSPDWVRKAIQLGLALARLLHFSGYSLEPKKKKLVFPLDQIANTYNEWKNSGPDLSDSPDYAASSKEFDYPTDINGLGTYLTTGKIISASKWSILEKKWQEKKDKDSFARSVAIKGPKHLYAEGIPVEKIDNWLSADRYEIEGVRKTNNILRDYIAHRDINKTPVCVGVFGPPGSGKSFLVKEIANSLGIPKRAQATFNLAQFKEVDDLTYAINRIRDIHLQGHIPVVFWDEFDAKKDDSALGWLQYFLPIMQDGLFYARGVTYPVGAGIYFFAGATRSSYKEFCKQDTSFDPDTKKDDFQSRLSAFIDVCGPNMDPEKDFGSDLYLVRRALHFYHAIKANAPNLLNAGKERDEINAQEKVVDYFLRGIDKYRYGTRSMHTLIKMCNLVGKERFELSCLPPKDLQYMHIISDTKSVTPMPSQEV
jgi:hypothetical protein